MAYPRYQLARAFKYIVDVGAGGGLQTNSTAWVQLATVTNGPGAGAYDMTLQAAIGDVIEYTINGLWNTAAVAGRLDVATVISGSPVNSFGRQSLTAGTTYGVQSWSGQASIFAPISGSAWLTIQSGDLASGFVTLRPYIRVDSATNRDLARGAANPFFLCAKNLGPVDPN